MQKYCNEELIKYLDVDKNKKLGNRAIVNYLQNTAVYHADSIGDGVNSADKTHTVWLLLNWKIKVFDRPKCEDKIKINTWARKMEKCYSLRDFEIFNGDNKVAIATSRWVLVNTETGKIERVSEELKEKYNLIDQCVFEDGMVEKLKEPENMELMYEDTIGRTRIDTNNHLNNLYYLDYAIESLPEEVYENSTFNNIEIMYKKEIKYKEKIKCLYKYEDSEHIVAIKSEDLKTLHAIIKLK